MVIDPTPGVVMTTTCFVCKATRDTPFFGASSFVIFRCVDCQRWLMDPRWIMKRSVN